VIRDTKLKHATKQQNAKKEFAAQDLWANPWVLKHIGDPVDEPLAVFLVPVAQDFCDVGNERAEDYTVSRIFVWLAISIDWEWLILVANHLCGKARVQEWDKKRGCSKRRVKNPNTKPKNKKTGPE
jgi:hypothetical protein